MFAYVHSLGWMPRLMAAFSAGSPKASQPIGFRTFSPRRRWYKPMASLMPNASAWPMCMSPEGYGNICRL